MYLLAAQLGGVDAGQWAGGLAIVAILAIGFVKGTAYLDSREKVKVAEMSAEFNARMNEQELRHRQDMTAMKVDIDNLRNKIKDLEDGQGKARGLVLRGLQALPVTNLTLEGRTLIIEGIEALH